MMKVIKVSAILICLCFSVKGQVSISQTITPLDYTLNVLQLELNAGFNFGPPAPPFLGAWTSGTSGDTLFVYPIYSGVGSFGQFASARLDTITLNIPSGINKVLIHSGLRRQNATTMSYDTAYAFNSETLLLSALSIDHFELSKGIIAQPNPVFDYLILNSRKDIEIFDWIVYSSTGQCVLKSKTKQTTTINFSQLAEGIYLLQINTSKGIIRKTISKTRR